MKINYDLKLKEELEFIGDKKPTLLLHVCCGPCSSNVIKELCEHFIITLYYSNSNIYPSEEYIRRRDELIEFIRQFNNDHNQNIQVIEDQYNHDEWMSHLYPIKEFPEGSLRCNLCYNLRMRRAYDYAQFHKYDYWTTVLSVSPHKNSQWINEIGEKWNAKHSKFLYADFKKNDGYLKSTLMTKEYNMYRQDYCGCEMSLQESIVRKQSKENSQD